MNEVLVDLLFHAESVGGPTAVQRLLHSRRRTELTSAPAWNLFADVPCVAVLDWDFRSVRTLIAHWVAQRADARRGTPGRAGNAKYRVLGKLPRLAFVTVLRQVVTELD